MNDEPAKTYEGDHKIDDLILDKLDALKVLRADNDEDKGKILESIGANGKAEQDILDQLAKIKPLWRPDRFEEAHRLAMRSLEVLDRNGARPAKLPKIGPLKPIAEWLVQQINRWIVRNHQNTIVDRVRKLYERREANSVWGSPEHMMLRRARINVVQVEGKLKSNALGLPTFLLGGAFLSTIIGGIQSLIRSALDSTLGVVIFSAVLLLVLFGLAWAALYAAAVSRKRIRMATDQPLKALYETIGACGEPPRDESYNFAVYAIVITVLAWIVIPLAFWFAFRAGDKVVDKKTAVDLSRSTLDWLTALRA